MKAQAALAEAVAALRAAGVPDAPRDARGLLAHALGLAYDRLNMHLHDDLPPGVAERLGALVKTRASRVPMAQILGKRLFWGREFQVTADTLDPRPETEILVQEALSAPFFSMLDLGTGTGCILISCLLGMPMARGLGTDISPAALEVARANAARHGADRARFVLSDWCQEVTGRFDLIVSNPPYIAEAEMADLAPEVLHEPHLALTPGGDGLEPYRLIARQAPPRLMPGGRLIVEIGPTQGAEVAGLFRAQGLQARILSDLDGRDRVVSALKPAENSDCAAT